MYLSARRYHARADDTNPEPLKLPTRAELLALRSTLAALAGPDPATDYRIAELFDIAPDPDSFGSELTPFGSNGFDWRAPAFTADAGAVAALARQCGVEIAVIQADDSAALSALLRLVDQLVAGD